MTSYTNIFGGTPVNPAGVSYAAYSISADIELAWPNVAEAPYIMAQVLEVSASVSSCKVFLPDAREGSQGYTFLFTNTGGTHSIELVKSTGASVQVVAAGESYMVWNRDNTTAAGTWFSLGLGMSVVDANAVALAGLGLEAISATLNVDYPVTALAANYNMSIGDRASVLNNTGGTLAFTMPAPGSAGSGWFVMVKNSGSGTLTINPNGAETIDATSSIQLISEESTILVTDGVNWFSIGRGRQLNYTTTRLSLAISPTSGTMTLSAAQAANQVLEFTGVLTGNLDIVVPTTIQVYYITNSTTGAFTLTVKTSAGTGIAVATGTRNILYSDGTNVVQATPGASGTVSSVGSGTGLTGGPITSTGTLSIATTGVVAGTYGSATQVPVIAINAQGQETSASNVSISIGSGNIGATAFDGLTYEGSPHVTNDAIPFYDQSATANRKTGFQDVFKVINGMSSKATPVGADELVINDSAASFAPKKTTVTGIFDSLGAAASQLFGRGTSGGVVPITLGTGLSMAGTTLSASGGALVLLDTKTASASSQLDFTSVITSSYDYYVLEIDTLVLSNSAADLQVRYSTDNGSTFITTSSYQTQRVERTLGGTTATTSGATQTASIIGPGATLGGYADGKIEIYNPSATTSFSYHTLVGRVSSSLYVYETYTSQYAGGAAVNAIRFFPSAGNFTSGSIRLYGVKNS